MVVSCGRFGSDTANSPKHALTGLAIKCPSVSLHPAGRILSPIGCRPFPNQCLTNNGRIRAKTFRLLIHTPKHWVQQIYFKGLNSAPILTSSLHFVPRLSVATVAGSSVPPVCSLHIRATGSARLPKRRCLSRHPGCFFMRAHAEIGWTPSQVIVRARLGRALQWAVHCSCNAAASSQDRAACFLPGKYNSQRSKATSSLCGLQMWSPWRRTSYGQPMRAVYTHPTSIACQYKLVKARISGLKWIDCGLHVTSLSPMYSPRAHPSPCVQYLQEAGELVRAGTCTTYHKT